mgnify:CR=1 FL=1
MVETPILNAYVARYAFEGEARETFLQLRIAPPPPVTLSIEVAHVDNGFLLAVIFPQASTERDTRAIDEAVDRWLRSIPGRLIPEESFWGRDRYQEYLMASRGDTIMSVLRNKNEPYPRK